MEASRNKNRSKKENGPAVCVFFCVHQKEVFYLTNIIFGDGYSFKKYGDHLSVHLFYKDFFFKKVNWTSA